MNPAPKNLRICKNGHRYYKSSSCPVCPVCEKKRKPDKGFLSLLSAPARRALERAGVTTLSKLSKKTEEEILQLHGVGSGTIPALCRALKAKGSSFQTR